MALGPFDKIKRRNADFLLIETIKQIGVSNYSLLARMTGLNAETVRYKVSRQLPGYGLGVQTNLNYGELGMSVGLLTAEAGDAKDWADELSYAFFEGKVIGSGKHVCLFAVPFRFKKKYLDILSSMAQKKQISSFETIEAKWVRYPSFRPEFYNFEERKWTVDWTKVEATQGESGPTAMDVNREAQLDYFDVKIIKALQENPTVSLAKVAAEMNANPRTVRYHHAEHVVGRKFILNSNVRWKRPVMEGKPGDLVQMLVLFRNVGPDAAVKARKAVNKIPFTWFEGGSEAGDYFAMLDVPLERFYETMRHIESHFEDIGARASVDMLDSQKTRYLYLPDEMFDPKRGWTLPGYKQEMANPPEEKES